MTQLILDISMSLDGYVAGPNQTLEEPLGAGGMDLHEWVIKLAAWRERHGLEGGEHGPDSDLVAEGIAATGAVVMGRRMFSGGSGPWEDDPNADGWWGDDPPFRVPVFVLTHHQREPVEKQGGTSFTFVTDARAGSGGGRRQGGVPRRRGRSRAAIPRRGPPRRAADPPRADPARRRRPALRRRRAAAARGDPRPRVHRRDPPAIFADT